MSSPTTQWNDRLPYQICDVLSYSQSVKTFLQRILMNHNNGPSCLPDLALRPALHTVRIFIGFHLQSRKIEKQALDFSKHTVHLCSKEDARQYKVDASSWRRLLVLELIGLALERCAILAARSRHPTGVAYRPHACSIYVDIQPCRFTRAGIFVRNM